MIITWSGKDGKLLLSDDILDAIGYPERIKVEAHGNGGLRLRPCGEDEGSKVVVKQRRPRLSVGQTRREELGLGEEKSRFRVRRDGLGLVAEREQ